MTLQTRRGWLNSITAIAGCASGSCSGRQKKATGEGVSKMDRDGGNLFIGRFALRLPPDIRIKGRSQSIFRVWVKSKRIPAGSFESLWEQNRLGEIRVQPKPANVPDRIVRSYQLSRDSRAALYYNDPKDPESRQLEVFRETGGVVVMAMRAGLGGQERDMESLVAHVVDSFAPQSRIGFCLEDGAIVCETAANESSQSMFEHVRLQNIEISLNTTTVRNPRTLDDISVAHELQMALGASTAKVMNSERRITAGLEGLEERIQLLIDGEAPAIRFSWKYPGDSLVSTRPQITFQAMCHESDAPVFVPEWEKMLASLRQVPVGR